MINNWFLQRTLNDIDFYQPSHFYNDDMTMMFIYIYIDLWTDISVQKKLDGDRTKQHFDTGSYPEYETFINHN